MNPPMRLRGPRIELAGDDLDTRLSRERLGPMVERLERISAKRDLTLPAREFFPPLEGAGYMRDDIITVIGEELSGKRKRVGSVRAESARELEREIARAYVLLGSGHRPQDGLLEISDDARVTYKMEETHSLRSKARIVVQTRDGGDGQADGFEDVLSFSVQMNYAPISRQIYKRRKNYWKNLVHFPEVLCRKAFRKPKVTFGTKGHGEWLNAAEFLGLVTEYVRSGVQGSEYFAQAVQGVAVYLEKDAAQERYATFRLRRAARPLIK